MHYGAAYYPEHWPESGWPTDRITGRKFSAALDLAPFDVALLAP